MPKSKKRQNFVLFTTRINRLRQNLACKRIHLNCAKTENKLDELSHVSRSRLRKSDWLIDKDTQHSASESRGTQERENSTVCSRDVQQVYGIGGCT